MRPDTTDAVEWVVLMVVGVWGPATTASTVFCTFW